MKWTTKILIGFYFLKVSPGLSEWLTFNGTWETVTWWQLAFPYALWFTGFFNMAEGLWGCKVWIDGIIKHLNGGGEDD